MLSDISSDSASFGTTRGPAITLVGSIAPTAFEHDDYLQLVVERSDGQLIGAVPVRFDVGVSAVLIALPAGAVSTALQPRSPMVAPRLPQSIASPGGDRAAAR